MLSWGQGWRSASRVRSQVWRGRPGGRLQSLGSPLIETECSRDVKWRIHPCHVSKKSKPSDLDELRQLRWWTGLESYRGISYRGPCMEYLRALRRKNYANGFSDRTITIHVRVFSAFLAKRQTKNNEDKHWDMHTHCTVNQQDKRHNTLHQEFLTWPKKNPQNTIRYSERNE